MGPFLKKIFFLSLSHTNPSSRKKYVMDKNATSTKMPDFEDEVEDFGFFEEKRRETEQFLQALKNLELLSVDSYTSYQKQKKNEKISIHGAKLRLGSPKTVSQPSLSKKTSPAESIIRLSVSNTKTSSRSTSNDSTSTTHDSLFTSQKSTPATKNSTSSPKLRIAHIPSPSSSAKKVSSSPPPGSVTTKNSPSVTKRRQRKRSNSKDSEDVTEELWKIFVWYATHGDPTTPQSLAYTEWLRFLRDCGVMKSSSTFVGDGNAQHAMLIYKQVTKSRNTVSRGRKKEVMHFRDFLEGVMHVSFRVFPHRKEDEFECERAYERLLRDYVLPYAKRLKPIDISQFESSTQIKNILRYYEKSLLRVFENYSRHLGQFMRHVCSTKQHMLKYLERASLSKRDYCISADRWLKFCNDFGLNRIISMCKLVHIYLASATTLDRNSGIHEMQFKGFQKALLRAATVLYEDPQTCRGVPCSNQFRGLLLWMFRSISAESSLLSMMKLFKFSRTFFHFFHDF